MLRLVNQHCEVQILNIHILSYSVFVSLFILTGNFWRERSFD